MNIELIKREGEKVALKNALMGAVAKAKNKLTAAQDYDYCAFHTRVKEALEAIDEAVALKNELDK